MIKYLKEQWSTGRAIYGKRTWRETRRTTLYTARAIKNKAQLRDLVVYFATYEPVPHMLETHVGMLEVISRIFLFKDSTAKERLRAITDHFDLLPSYFTREAIADIYDSNSEKGIVVWEDEELELRAVLWFHPGQRKEGFFSLFLYHGEEGVYHINFRLGYDWDGQPCIWVGTIQGYKKGLDRTKKITKKMFGYRPKNLIFFILRQLVTCLGIPRILAVSDEGFYTNTHLIRMNRSKKVEFNSFWEELGGHVCKEDKRFFEIPIEEARKTYETAKTHKRNMYRKRYELLDRYIEQIQEKSQRYLVSRDS